MDVLLTMPNLPHYVHMGVIFFVDAQVSQCAVTVILLASFLDPVALLPGGTLSPWLP